MVWVVAHIAHLMEILISEAQIWVRWSVKLTLPYFEGGESESGIGRGVRGFAGDRWGSEGHRRDRRDRSRQRHRSRQASEPECATVDRRQRIRPQRSAAAAGMRQARGNMGKKTSGAACTK